MEKHPTISGTPWHVEILRKDEDERKRHRSRCVFYGKQKECTNEKSPNYCFICGGSSHCDYYKENQSTMQEKINLRGWSYDYEQKEKTKKNPTNKSKYFCIGYDRGICRIEHCNRFKKVCMDKMNCSERTSIIIEK